MSADNAAVLGRMISGYATSQVVYVIAKLGIADLLVNESRTTQQLAAAGDTNQTGLPVSRTACRGERRAIGGRTIANVLARSLR